MSPASNDPDELLDQASAVQQLREREEPPTEIIDQHGE